jgi:hypothetical protein
MHRFWKLFTGPIVENVKPQRIMEIGAEFGWNTRHILEYCRRNGARADVVDPVALPSLQKVIDEFPDVVTFHNVKSVEVVTKAPTPDILFLDGDHNWRTVFTELSQLYAHARDNGARPPILLAHDCAWPYARRDMYYDPDAFLPEERHPFAYNGIKQGQSELCEDGLNDRFANALHEGGPENGVLTGIEDFIKSSPTPFSLTVMPFFNGLGIAIPQERQTPELDAIIKNLHSGETLMEACKSLEGYMMTIFAEHLQREKMLTRRTDALKRARTVIETQTARIAQLEARLGVRAESVG